MKCPVCKTPGLLMTERLSVEIDYCPSCRGVWLDRGELDKLIAMGNDVPETSTAPRSHHDDHRELDERRKYSDYRSEHHERERTLFDMFDFD